MISYLVITPFGGRGLDHLANKDVDDVFKVVRSETLDGTKIKQMKWKLVRKFSSPKVYITSLRFSIPSSLVYTVLFIFVPSPASLTAAIVTL